MSTNTPADQEGIDVRTTNYDALITGPWTEPADQGGANYSKCADCGRESLRRGDLERAAFHADACDGSQPRLFPGYTDRQWQSSSGIITAPPSCLPKSRERSTENYPTNCAMTYQQSPSQER